MINFSLSSVLIYSLLTSTAWSQTTCNDAVQKFTKSATSIKSGARIDHEWSVALSNEAKEDAISKLNGKFDPPKKGLAVSHLCWAANNDNRRCETDGTVQISPRTFSTWNLDKTTRLPKNNDRTPNCEGPSDSEWVYLCGQFDIDMDPDKCLHAISPYKCFARVQVTGTKTYTYGCKER